MPISREEIQERLAGGSRSLAGLDLAGVDLSRMDLRGVDLSRADLSTADLRWAILEGADLSASVLRQADLRWAVLRGAHLSQADLRRANLAWADLEGAELLGADLDNAILDNANLGEEAGRRRGRAPRPARVAAAAPGESRWSGFAWREASPAALLGLCLGALVVIMGWGWLYRRFYYDTFFESGNLTAPPDLLPFLDLANLAAGLVEVLLRSVAAALALPVLVLALALLVLAFLALPLALVYLGERMLGDIIRPAWRPVVVLGLFLAYFAVFIMAFPVAAFASDWVQSQGLPKGPVLGDLLGLWQVGGWPGRLGLLAVAGAGGYCLWIAWRLASRRLHVTEVPTRWRLRYPALNDALVRARASRLFERNEPLTETERRRGLAALAGGALLLATLMTGVGIVSAYDDMCDGGRLPRVQLYVDRSPALADAAICQRLLVTAEGSYYVFFPNQTTQLVPSDMGTRVVNLQAFPTESVQLMQASGGANLCPTCLNEAGRVTGDEVFVYDPSLIQTRGPVQTVSLPTGFTVQPADATQPANVLLTPDTQVQVNGLPASADAIQPGRPVVVRGRLAADGSAVVAVVVNVVEGSPAPAGTPGSGTPAPAGTPRPTALLDVDLSNPAVPVFNGSGWTPGNLVALGLGRKADAPPVLRIPLPGGTVTVGPDGSFSVPIQYQPEMPTGPDYSSVATDPNTGQVAVSDWLLSPPPPTAVPPTAPPQQTQEVPTQPPVTPTVPPTNTPFPTGKPPGWQAPADCTPDEFEYDNTRPWQKEIYGQPAEASGGGGKGVQHNFCPRNDVDLSWFYVKTGRYYRVETRNLAAGVDTVMAVGDLSNSTPCQPAGCWNDDAAALTFASRIEFQAIQDAKALITVSNRGGNFGTSATYELVVVEFVPTPTPSASPVPSGTATATPTATPTPRPFVDLCDRLVTASGGNYDCLRACVGYPIVGTRYYGAISRPGDDDWFIPTMPGAGTTLPAGNYKLTLQPPDGQDYDMTLRDATKQTLNQCPIYNNMVASGAGEGEPEVLFFTLVSPLQIAIEVTSFYGYYDPFHPYSLLLEPDPGRPTATATPGSPPPPTDPPTATWTPVPTATPTPKFLPPVVTPTPSVTPVSAALLPRWRR